MKQRTPHDQLITVVSSLEGNLSNFKEGILDDEVFIKRIESFLEHVKEIIPHTIDAEWKNCTDDTPLPRPTRTGFEDVYEEPITSKHPLRPKRT